MNLPIGGDNAYFLDLYSRFLRDPASVPADWQVHLASLETRSLEPRSPVELGIQLSDLYRTYGYRQASLDPLGLVPPNSTPELERLASDAGFVTITLGGQSSHVLQNEAIERLTAIYCGTAAIEAAHLVDQTERSWLYDQYERELAQSPDEAMLSRTLEAVMLADEFETFVKTKWPTKKRFGIEGAETAAVIVREALRAAAQSGVGEAVIGGMHRGRLATLATVFGKSLPALLAEIKGRDTTGHDSSFTGDVPYHNGLAATVDTGAGAIDVRLLPHPSHLIVVAPVAMGAARARQEQKAASAGSQNLATEVLPLLMHTDAAFSGQGLIWELFQLSGLKGYGVGGVVHLVLDNQIGFTTLPSEGRSSPYPSDVGKAFGVPIFHVNGDDPIAAAAVTRVAVAWRNATGKDAILHLVCYRRNGHNELDEPRFTQPLTWAAIDSRPTLKQVHTEFVRASSPAAYETAETKRTSFHRALDDAYATFDNSRPNTSSSQTEIFAAPQPSLEADINTITGVEREKLIELARRLTSIDAEFDPDPKVGNFLRTRLTSIESDSGFNVATAEALAFASLLDEGTSVRLSGQDSVRGTFTQRHLAIHDKQTGRAVIPLAAIGSNGARFDAVNSPLIEYGVLSFEYGMSLADQTRLIVWEAQFGDFLNGAQVVVDQFITTAEAKWRMASSLVMALPHGQEGQGPDHSSARIERILQSCVDRNLVVANPSTPANLFHLYRRQVRSPLRKPLFLIAPKSLLRLRECVSKLADIDKGTSFRAVIAEPPAGPNCRKVVLCSGKIAYAIRAAVDQEGIDDVAILRIEQLYPFPEKEVIAALQRFQGVPLAWCQEEPKNQGPWSFIRDSLTDLIGGRSVEYVGRPPMAAAAGGSIDRHEVEQAAIVDEALAVATRAQAAE